MGHFEFSPIDEELGIDHRLGHISRMAERARKGWLVGIANRHVAGKVVDFRWFHVGARDQVAASNALRQNLGMGANVRRIVVAREMTPNELAASRLAYRQVKNLHVTAEEAP